MLSQLTMSVVIQIRVTEVNASQPKKGKLDNNPDAKIKMAHSASE